MGVNTLLSLTAGHILVKVIFTWPGRNIVVQYIQYISLPRTCIVWENSSSRPEISQETLNQAVFDATVSRIYPIVLSME